MDLFFKIFLIVFFVFVCFLSLLVVIVFVIGMLHSCYCEYKQYRFTCKKINKYEKLFPWIDVADCLPSDVDTDSCDLFIVASHNIGFTERDDHRAFCIARYKKDIGWYTQFYDNITLDVKYWIPLPELPDEVTNV